MINKQKLDASWKILDKFILQPVSFISVSHGRIIMVVCVICLSLFITRPKGDRITLPDAAQDTVGNIPIIEHMDDGRIEFINEKNESNYYPPPLIYEDVHVSGGYYSGGMVTTSPIIWGGSD